MTDTTQDDLVKHLRQRASKQLAATPVSLLEKAADRIEELEVKLAQQDDLVRRMNDARDFPANTCGASRHAAMIAEALCSGEDYPMLAEEPDHCGGSIAATVAALWECRTKLAQQDDLVQAAVAVREAQKAYFKDRSRDNLIASKQAEAALDKMLAAIRKGDE